MDLSAESECWHHLVLYILQVVLPTGYFFPMAPVFLTRFLNFFFALSIVQYPTLGNGTTCHLRNGRLLYGLDKQ